MWREPNFNFCTTTIIIEEADNVFFNTQEYSQKITNMIKCLNMKKTFLKKIPPKKICITKFQSMSTYETNDQMSETQFFFVFFNVFPRFKNRNNPMVCMLIFIFTFFLHEPKKFCALYYTNIVININSRVQTDLYRKS